LVVLASEDKYFSGNEDDKNENKVSNNVINPTNNESIDNTTILNGKLQMQVKEVF